MTAPLAGSTNVTPVGGRDRDPWHLVDRRSRAACRPRSRVDVGPGLAGRPAAAQDDRVRVAGQERPRSPRPRRRGARPGRGDRDRRIVDRRRCRDERRAGAARRPGRRARAGRSAALTSPVATSTVEQPLARGDHQVAAVVGHEQLARRRRRPVAERLGRQPDLGARRRRSRPRSTVAMRAVVVADDQPVPARHRQRARAGRGDRRDELARAQVVGRGSPCRSRRAAARRPGRRRSGVLPARLDRRRPRPGRRARSWR